MRRRKGTQTHRAGGHVEPEAEIGVMLPQARGHQRLQEARGDEEGPSPRGFRGSMVLLTS